uniref:NADH-ubiquinone oxidoreductase chain 4L n=1 Tax=Lasioderma serricorne TaxID=295660 RepID=A0A344BNW7_9COLE|nr:NADH dehydrogenase subunit 4L [Lasioderma serricorne]AWY13622.1 NADH dehydrogenase subunit 4L [Lasioderma serricorne]
MNLFMFSFYMGVLSFVLNRKHLLTLLLSLEFMIITLYFGLILYMNMYMYEFFFLMIFLTISVCESALGLSILVVMMRMYGNDYFKTFNVLW